MKYMLVVMMMIGGFSAVAQTAHEYKQSAIIKHAARDFKGAISDYSKAIELNKDDSDAYLHRGNCEFQIEEFDAALADFNKTIVLNPKNAKAYYSRAVSYATKKKYNEALEDVNRVIELDSTYLNCYNLRGQLRTSTGNKQGACDDFTHSKAIGDANAEEFLKQHCGSLPGYGESLLLNLPVEEHWKIGDNQDNGQVQVLDFIHENEKLDSWSELINMTAIKGVTGIAMDTAMRLMFAQTEKNSPAAKLTFIEKDESTLFQWIIFTIESPSFVNDPKPESQLWYIIQGKQALYTNFRAIKKAAIPDELKEKWTRFFKTGKIIYK
ncbi:MAG: tetratricopeptide repeat protein [Ignavibacteria bacterium]|nr:tetratricopeptide repeat protein [Ignavibacteria bacterium]